MLNSQKEIFGKLFTKKKFLSKIDALRYEYSLKNNKKLRLKIKAKAIH